YACPTERPGLTVVISQWHRPAEQAALGVDFLFPDLGAEQRLLAVGGERAGQRHAEADLDRVLGLRQRRQRRREEARRQHYGAEDAGNAAARNVIDHVLPPKGGFSIDNAVFGTRPLRSRT